MQDASLVALSGLLSRSCWAERRRPALPLPWPAAAGVCVCAAALAAANPPTTAAAQVLAGGVAVGPEASRHPVPDPEATPAQVAVRTRRRRGLPAALLGAGVVFELAGRTGGAAVPARLGAPAPRRLARAVGRRVVADRPAGPGGAAAHLARPDGRFQVPAAIRWPP